MTPFCGNAKQNRIIMKKLIALMCVGALALAGVNGLEAKTKVKKAKRIAKTEQVCKDKVANCEKAVCDKEIKKDDCCEKKDMKINKLQKADCKKMGDAKLRKAEIKGDCKEMKGECQDKKTADCNKCEKAHECSHKSPCCKEGACKMDRSCGKEKCKPGSEQCCK